MKHGPFFRFAVRAITIFVPLGCSSCAVPLGPGYTTLKQEVGVQFDTSPTPVIHVQAQYTLKNTGNQPLPFLDVRMPSRRFAVAAPVATWDDRPVAFSGSPDTPRNARLSFEQPWTKSAKHTLRITYDIRPHASGENGLEFTPDAFFLSEGGWNPEPAPSGALFGFGGVPPDKWSLVVEVPRGFRVHASGRRTKESRGRGGSRFVFRQTAGDLSPFVVAGRYAESQLSREPRSIFLWTRTPPDPGSFETAGRSLEREMNAYDIVFGLREKSPSPLWIVECPAASGCIAGRNARFAHFLGGQAGAEEAAAEMVSSNTVLVDLSAGSSRFAAMAGPSLAASWLGYGRNPGFYEQDAPLNALPLFAAALGREATDGPGARADMIRRALADIPTARRERSSLEPANVVRAKSFLFFFALQDRYGPKVFDSAIQHMLHARQGRGFNLSDLIAAFEQETHENVAEFVRLWMKHPGVPEEFRARYGEAAASTKSNSEETKP